jgi:2-dehydro-3-deoxyglucarate aldolase
MKPGLRSALREGRPCFGSWIQFGDAGVAEVMATAGFDWLGIDLEHSAIDLGTASRLIQVIELAGCTPLVRLSSNDPVQARRVMDAGAAGIIIPAVQSAAEARQAVEAVRYPPHGRRGVGLGRAHGYGARFAEYMQESEHAVVVPMIEHAEAVDRAEEILDVPGVDAVFIGPYDLSASYGVAGELHHPLVSAGMRRVVDVAARKNIAAGIHVVHPPVSQVADRLREGFRLIAYGGDMLFLTPAAREAAGQLRGLGQRA